MAKNLWVFRELFYILSWRDIKVRYKQTVLGAAWSIIRPLLTAIIFNSEEKISCRFPVSSSRMCSVKFKLVLSVVITPKLNCETRNFIASQMEVYNPLYPKEF